MNTNLEQIFSGLSAEIERLVEEKLNQKISELRLTMAKSEKPLMTAREAAEYLSMSVNSIYQYAQNGRLSFYKPTQGKNRKGIEIANNCKLMFKREELDAYLLDSNKHYLSDLELEKEADTRIAKKKLKYC